MERSSDEKRDRIATNSCVLESDNPPALSLFNILGGRGYVIIKAYG